MPDTKSPKEESNSESKGGAKRLVMVAVLCVALLGAGFVLGSKMSAPAEAAEASEDAEEEDDSYEVGYIVDLDAVNINLSDDHYLRVSISLGLSPKVKLKKPEEFHTAPASDLALAAFSGRTIEELETHDGREAIRTELLEKLDDHYHGEVVSLYFTEFVMQ